MVNKPQRPLAVALIEKSFSLGFHRHEPCQLAATNAGDKKGIETPIRNTKPAETLHAALYHRSSHPDGDSKTRVPMF